MNQNKVDLIYGNLPCHKWWYVWQTSILVLAEFDGDAKWHWYKILDMVENLYILHIGTKYAVYSIIST